MPPQAGPNSGYLTFPGIQIFEEINIVMCHDANNTNNTIQCNTKK